MVTDQLNKDTQGVALRGARVPGLVGESSRPQPVVVTLTPTVAALLAGALVPVTFR